MPTRIYVPPPLLLEESRQLAEAIADLHYVMSLIVEGARELIPGEAVDEFTAAWSKSQDSMNALVRNLLPRPPNESPAVPHAPVLPAQLETGELTGEVGKIKRSTLGRLRDRFLMFWNSDPRTDEKRATAAVAATDYLEFGATVVSSIPGYDKVEELLLLGKQLLSARAKRGI